MVYFMVIPGGWLADNFRSPKSSDAWRHHYYVGPLHACHSYRSNILFGFNARGIGNWFAQRKYLYHCWQLYKPGDVRRDAGYTIFYMSINIGSFLGFLICSYLGEKIGWHWGFGAAGIGMFFGVLQYFYFRRLLGSAGEKPNDMPEATRVKYLKWSRVSVVILAAVVALGLFGFINVDARLFAENFAVFLTVVGFSYFAYLFLFAGLDTGEKKNLFLLLILFIAAAAFWSGFDQSAGSLSIFARDYTDLSVGGYIIPIGWLNLPTHFCGCFCSNLCWNMDLFRQN